MKFGQTNFVLKQGDITKEQVDAIVNAANCTLSGGGGVDGAIHRAGGPSIAAECKQIINKIKKCPVGESAITGAGRLKAKWIVHTVGPIWAGGKKGEAELLENCFYNSLMMAKEYGAQTIALPAISTGAYNYPMDQAAEVAAKTCKEFCEQFTGLTEVRFVLFTPEAFASFEKAFASL